jgi:hypothetical protein
MRVDAFSLPLLDRSVGLLIRGLRVQLSDWLFGWPLLFFLSLPFHSPSLPSARRRRYESASLRKGDARAAGAIVRH